MDRTHLTDEYPRRSEKGDSLYETGTHAYRTGTRATNPTSQETTVDGARTRRGSLDARQCPDLKPHLIAWLGIDTVFAPYRRVRLPMEHVTYMRVHRAQALLLSTDIKLDATAPEVGYHSAVVFSRAFVRFTGMTPTEYRRRGRPRRRG